MRLLTTMTNTSIWFHAILLVLLQPTTASRTSPGSNSANSRSSNSAISTESGKSDMDRNHTPSRSRRSHPGNGADVNMYGSQTSSSTNKKHSPIYDVIEEIFSEYKSFARPVKSPATVTVVNVTFNLMSINHVDAKQQTFTQTIFMDLVWFDEHLTWNTSQHQGLDHIVVPQGKVWLPDLTITPFAETMTPLGHYELPLRVESSGKIWWQPNGVFTTHCGMDITYYPFDKQVCMLRLEAWSSRMEDVVLRLREPVALAVSGKLYTRNSEWQLLSVMANQSDYLEDYGGFSGVMLNFTLRRRPTFSLLVVSVPTILLAFMSTFVFLLPAQCGEKIALSSTIFLTFAVSLSIMFSDLPHSSLHVSMHVTFLSALAIFSSLAVLLSLLVLRLLQRHYTGAPAVGTGWSVLVTCVRLYRKGEWLSLYWCIFENLKEACEKRAERWILFFCRVGEGGGKKEKTASAKVSKGLGLMVTTPTADERELEMFTFPTTSCDLAPNRSSIAMSDTSRKSSRRVQAWSARRSRMSSVRSSFQPQLSAGLLEVNGLAGIEENDHGGEELRKEEGQDNVDDEDTGLVTWEEVAQSLDFILFRCFLGVVIVCVTVSIAFVVVQYSEGGDGSEWGQDKVH